MMISKAEAVGLSSVVANILEWQQVMLEKIGLEIFGLEMLGKIPEDRC